MANPAKAMALAKARVKVKAKVREINPVKVAKVAKVRAVNRVIIKLPKMASPARAMVHDKVRVAKAVKAKVDRAKIKARRPSPFPTNLLKNPPTANPAKVTVGVEVRVRGRAAKDKVKVRVRVKASPKTAKVARVDRVAKAGPVAAGKVAPLAPPVPNKPTDNPVTKLPNRIRPLTNPLVRVNPGRPEGVPGAVAIAPVTVPARRAMAVWPTPAAIAMAAP